MKSIEYLKLLANQFPNQEKTCIEIANLSSILTLPKGTEFFLSDLHGENEGFIHLLRSASGIIRSKLKFIFEKEMSDEEILEFANIIYYPIEKLDLVDFRNRETYDFQKTTILRLIKVVKDISSKYSKSKVRKTVNSEYAYILDELIYKEVDRDNVKKEFYYDEIVNSIIEIGLAKRFIIAMCELIQKLAVDTLHIVGDIFDRGPRHDLILDELMNFHNVDIEWGNHDIEWMGAALGNTVLILNCLRIAVRYNCYDMLEDGYGISLRALNDFAARIYENDPCELFMPKILDENKYDVVRPSLSAKIQKALAIMQFKVEGQLIKKHPEYNMKNRIMLERINYKDFTVDVDGKTFNVESLRFTSNASSKWSERNFIKTYDKSDTQYTCIVPTMMCDWYNIQNDNGNYSSLRPVVGLYTAMNINYSYVLGSAFGDEFITFRKTQPSNTSPGIATQESEIGRITNEATEYASVI